MWDSAVDYACTAMWEGRSFNRSHRDQYCYRPSLGFLDPSDLLEDVSGQREKHCSGDALWRPSKCSNRCWGSDMGDVEGGFQFKPHT